MRRAYPPIINAAWLLAERGWRVTVFTAPIAGKTFGLPAHDLIEVVRFPERPSHVMSKRNYLLYCAQSFWLAWRLRPDVIYASDALGGGAGLIAARACGAQLIYHEHDSPSVERQQSALYKLRAHAARAADLVIFPNAQRGRIAREQIGFAAQRLRIVWNMPRRAEVPILQNTEEMPLIFYYHGNISENLLPEAAIDAARAFEGRIRVRAVGYIAGSQSDYIVGLVKRATLADGQSFFEYLGPMSRNGLLHGAASAHVGIAMMPKYTNDLNMHHMTGASNKIFDYMAAGLVPLVNDSPDWKETFVDTGHAIACDPNNSGSIQNALSELLTDPKQRRIMGARNRRKILDDWNYDTAFAPIINEMEHWERY